jgi:oxygen tolerance protein BatD
MHTKDFIKPMIIGTHLHIKFIVLFATVFLTVCVTAQVKFTTVISSNEIGRGDYVQVEFIIENAKQIDNLTPPSFPNFKIAEGPIQSSGMSIVNGNTSQYKGVSFVLQPLKMGKFAITGATAIVDGKPMHSNTVIVEVNASGPPANNTPMSLQPVWPDQPREAPAEYILKPGENIADKIKKNLFVRAQADKTTCFIGEPIVVTYKLYSRLRSESRVTKRPSLNGFSVYDMTDPNADIASVETLNGKQFAVHIIRKAQLIPLQAGTVELDPAEVENKVYFIKQSTNVPGRRHSLLDEIFGQSAEEGTETNQDITLQSQPLAITIKPLPELNKPADFNGAVGHFTIESSIENKKIAATDAGTLKVVVKGNGNLPIVNAPQIKWPGSIEAYDATAKENVDKTVAPLGGTKTFEYAFTPQKQGSYILPAIDFSYFDPTSASYKTIQTQQLTVDVSAASKKKQFATVYKQETNNIKIFFVQHLEWFFAILILSGLAIYLWRQNTRLKKAETKIKSAAEPVKTIAENNIPFHIPEPVEPLIRAKRMLANADYKGFYKELNQATWETLRDKLKVPASELNKQHIVQLLKTKGWDEGTIALLQQTLNECEMNLYTPDYNETNMQQTLQHAEMIIKYVGEGA